ncbi:MAG: acyl-CoA synthetase [Actinobacteria bacterium]|uniref:Acyl-CoA synthetase n=1 Tax=Candidatus Fonsibacter lacus TaxID=2576439 RepID=A0A965GCN2_9PROT|nr:acyl-CoA synthetase [Candidatus Fonsibacter lacus]
MRNVERIDPATVAPLHLRDLLADALNGGPAVALTERAIDEIPESAALLIETGGSTGEPKVVALSATAMKSSASLSNQALGAAEGDSWSLSLPLNHIAGVNQILRAIDLGSDPVEVGANFLSIVPTQLYRALEQKDSLFDQLKSAKRVLIGGAMIPKPLVERASEQGINLVASYGMTEMCGGCIYNGKALPGVAVEIRDAGRIALSGPMRAIGYLNNPVANAKAFVAEWFLTSDAGALDKNGILQVIGRVDDVIISGGEKISPNKVTKILQRYFPRYEIYVIGIPDEEWGQSLRVVMANNESSDGSRKITLQHIRDIVGGALGKVAAPRSLLLLSEIPTKENGKVDLLALTTVSPTEEY